MKTLVLLRHGKSGYPEGVADHERPLAPRGEREAALAGAWIRDQVGEPDLIVCSTATRTRETLAATGLEAMTTFSDEIYEAWPETLLGVVTELDRELETVLMIGHAPGMPGLALLLDDVSSLSKNVRAHFPTSAIAVLEFDGDWVDLAGGAATLTHFHIPR